jgi:predicted DNA-binding transcriptional regulator AlpA
MQYHATPPRPERRDIGSLDASWSSLLDQPVLSAEDAFLVLGIDRSTGYKAIREGTFPVSVLRIGRLIRVPTVGLRRLLGLDDSTGTVS